MRLRQLQNILCFRSFPPAVLLAAIAAIAPRGSVAAEPSYEDILTLPVLGDRIVFPSAVTVDETTGEIFVCDERGNRILIFDRNGVFSFEIVGGEIFSAPLDLAVHPEGYLFVITASSGSRGSIVKLDFDGQPIGEFALSGLPTDMPEPMLESLAMTADGNRLAVLDGRNNRLWIIEADGQIEGEVDLAVGLSKRELEDLLPSKVDIYADRALLAIPSMAQVWCFNLDGSSCGRIGERGGGVCGLLFPTAAALESSGNYIIVDQQRMVLLRWGAESNSCQGEYLGPGDAPGYFYYPYDIYLDTDGRLYVAQGYKGKVQIYSGLSPAPSGVMGN